MKLVYFTFAIFASTILAGCSYGSADKQKADTQLISSLLQCGPPKNCVITAASPSFSTLALAGTTTSCTTCHSGANLNAGLDITSYSSVLARVRAGDASCSLLYQKITGGSMAGNSTPAINSAVLNWIQGCAAP